MSRSFLRPQPSGSFVLLAALALPACTAVTPQVPDGGARPPDPTHDRVTTGGFEHLGSLQDLLRTGLREHGVARRIEDGAPVRVEGRLVASGPSTSGGRVAWNFLNTVSLLLFLGGPYLGSADATVQLRMYEGDTLLLEWTSTATARWRVHYEVLPRIHEARRRARHRAEELAVWAATRELAQALRAGSSAAGSGAVGSAP